VSKKDHRHHIALTELSDERLYPVERLREMERQGNEAAAKELGRRGAAMMGRLRHKGRT
jgi:hypothetical protein